MNAPALLVAARAKLLASPALTALSPVPSIQVGTNPNTGLPDTLTTPTVILYPRANAWHTNGTSARFPVIAASVWASGPPDSSDAEWSARAIAEAVVTTFDDPAGAHAMQWGPNVYVLRCRWSGELAVFEAENLPNTIRAECSFELETA